MKIFQILVVAVLAIAASVASARADYLSPRPMFGPTVAHHDYGRPYHYDRRHHYGPRRHWRDNYYGQQRRSAQTSRYYRYERRIAARSTAPALAYGATPVPRDNNAEKRAEAGAKCAAELANRSAGGYPSQMVWREYGCTVTSGVRESGYSYRP